MATQTQPTFSMTETKNRIKAKDQFISTITKFVFATLAFLMLCLQMQYKIHEVILFVILWAYQFVYVINVFYYNYSLKAHQIRFKKKQMFLQILISLIDCLYLVAIIIIGKLQYQYIYCNTTLVLSILIYFYIMRENRGELESLKKSYNFNLAQRLYVLLTSLFITLKFDNYINWEWVTAFWTLWIGLILLLGLSVGLIVITFSKVVSYLFDDSSTPILEIKFYFWTSLLSVSASLDFCFSALGCLQYVTNKSDYLSNFTILQYFIIGDFFLLLIYSTYFGSDLCEYVFLVLQDDEPLNSQQQFSMNQQYNQTLQAINQMSSRTQIPQVIQKISKTYFGVPTLKSKHNPNKDSSGCSPVLGKYQKGHKRAFSSQGVASQMFKELEIIPVEIDQNEKIENKTTNQVVNKYHAERKKCNSHLVTIPHEETINKQKNELSMSQTSNICIICYERGPNAVFMNCGHGGTCYQCAVDIWKRKEECYLCRDKIAYILQLNLEERQGDLFKVVSTTQMVEQFNK